MGGIQSVDSGLTWAAPQEITTSVKRPSWTWYATGPGVGLQLRSGRLVVPCNHAEDVAETQHPYLETQQRSRMVAHLIYSDDHGATWHIGATAAPHTNECQAAQLPDGRLLVNARNWGGNHRVLQVSEDDGLTLGPPVTSQALTEPLPHGSQASFMAVGTLLLFSNP